MTRRTLIRHLLWTPITLAAFAWIAVSIYNW